MPGRTSPLVPPRLVISEHVDEDVDTSSYDKLATTRRKAGPSPAVQEQGKPVSEWIDIDEAPKRRRRRSKRSTSGREKTPRQETTKPEESQLGRFLPRLSRILETAESNISSRSGTRVSDTSRRSDRNSRGLRHRDETASIHRRQPRYKSGSGVQRRTDSLLKINPSLLSVLSGLTSTSDRSSGSNSTITQRSYNRHSSHSSHSSRSSNASKTASAKPGRSSTYPESSTSSMPRSRSPNVFDYMQAPSFEDSHDDHSIISSASSSTSHYQPSDAGSSEAPATPSSRSTFPSPTTRRGSVAELRRKYDPHYAASSSSRDSMDSTDSSLRGSRKQPSMSDVLEDDDEDQCAGSPPTAPSELNIDHGYKRSSRSSSRSRHAEQRLQQQEESMREHINYTQPSYQHQYSAPEYSQQRTPSLSSSVASDPAVAYSQHQSLQHYQHAFPPTNATVPPSPSALAHQPPTLPHAPDAPDLHKTTLAGYELLASTIASPTSEITPLYRKFTYLHHRILLHLQDELSEMEAQLRTYDEIIAQAHISSTPPSPEQQQPPPASRRAENWHGGDLFVQRTSLLGRIFLKQEQYQRALRGYAESTKDGRAADEAEVKHYAAWMAEHKPVHAVEAEYLRHRDDLIAPGQQYTEVPKKPASREDLKTYWPVAVLVPVLLFALIPDLAGRLVVTALLAAGTGLVAGLTDVGGLLTAREWAISGAVYVLVMAGVAGVVPGRT